MPIQSLSSNIGHSGTKTQYETIFNEIQTKYIPQAIQKLVQTTQLSVLDDTVKLTPDLLKKQEHFITNSIIAIDNFFLPIEVVERVAIPSTFGAFAYIPVIIIHTEIVSKADKILVTAIGILLEKWQKCSLGYGGIIHGTAFGISKGYFKTWREESQKILLNIQPLWEKRHEPQFMLTSYCQICEYQNYCRRKAHEEDHLSLLGDY